MFPFQFAFSAETTFVKEGDAEYKSGNPIYDRWDQFYKLEPNQPEQAEKFYWS